MFSLQIVAQLGRTSLLRPSSRNFDHGRLYNYVLPAPRVTWRSKEPPRGSGGPGWLTATEQRDRPEVLQDKVRYLAHLLSCSRHTVVLTGAGTSTSAGVRQTARGSTGQGYQGKLGPDHAIHRTELQRSRTHPRRPSEPGAPGPSEPGEERTGPGVAHYQL